MREGATMAAMVENKAEEAAAREGAGRSGREKEKTKMRERQRRSVTTKIIQGLRKHGGYRLSARADINQVLRELAREAGWIVDPNGTTYRSKVPMSSQCSLCGSVRNSGAPTPASSVTGGGGGDGSTTASPHRIPVGLF